LSRHLGWRLVAVLLLLGVAGWVAVTRPARLGLDLRGGTQIVLEARDGPRQRVDDDTVARALEVLTPGGLLILADVFSSYRRRGPAVRMLRRRHAVVPAELGAVLADHRLAVIGCDHTRWFRLPDVQVIAVRQAGRRQPHAGGGGSGP
jgi:hypothetical protein